MSVLSGLVITPTLTQHRVSIDMAFEPSIGIMARRIDKLGLDIRSFREPLRRAVKQVVIPSIRTNFDVGGRPSWAPLSPRTLEQKRGRQKLVESGKLRRVMGYLKIWDIDRDRAMITDLPQEVWYGKLHQGGFGGATITSPGVVNPLTGRRGPSITEFASGEGYSVPARPFIMIQPEDEPQIERVFEEWLQERIVAAGLA